MLRVAMAAVVNHSRRRMHRPQAGETVLGISLLSITAKIRAVGKRWRRATSGEGVMLMKCRIVSSWELA